MKISLDKEVIVLQTLKMTTGGALVATAHHHCLMSRIIRAFDNVSDV